MKRLVLTLLLASCVCRLCAADEDEAPLAEADAIGTATNAVSAVSSTNLVASVNTNQTSAAGEKKAEVKHSEDDDILYRKKIISRTFKLVFANSDDVAKRFNDTWGTDWGMGFKVKQVASSFPEANMVTVTAPQPIVEQCADIVKEVDVEAKQVYIEARFVELSNSAMHKLGIDWSMLESMSGSSSLGGGFQRRSFGSGIKEYETKSSDGNASYAIDGRHGDMTYFNGTLDFSDLKLILSAFENDKDVRTFSNPKIIVSSGKRAIVDMTEKYPNVTISAKRTTTSATASSLDLDMKMTEIPGEDKMMFAKEAFFSWGISLEVTPRIATNGLINVSIVPTISDLKDYVTASAGTASSTEVIPYSKYPIINVQRLVTEFSMESGSTAVIGGLSKTVETSVDSGIPWLRNIWWIGPKLFGGMTRQKEQREILVFVTVGLADPHSMTNDVGLPKNAVLGRDYTAGIRREPGDRRHKIAGLQSLDLRSLEEQVNDPRHTNRTQNAAFLIKKADDASDAQEN